MTRQQITIAIRNLLDETEDKPGYAAPFTYDLFIDEVTDELARLDGLFVSFTADIASGQSAYSVPSLYRVTAVAVVYPNGVSYPCAQLTPQDMDARYPTWRTLPATGWPTCAIFQGANVIVLYPQPDYTLSSALIVEGFGVPSSAGASGVNVWPDPSDSCPLPEHVHVAVVYGTAYRRCIQFPTAENQARAGLLNAEYVKHRQRFFRELQEASRGTRTGDGEDLHRTL